MGAYIIYVTMRIELHSAFRRRCVRQTVAPQRGAWIVEVYNNDVGHRLLLFKQLV